MLKTMQFLRLVFVALFCAGAALAQNDALSYDEASGTLSLELSYDRAAQNAEARGCTQETFENGLVHSLIRNLFLYLPLEASYRDGVENVEVQVTNADGELKMYASGPLAALGQTNSQFRVFMNSFASTRAGTCFALNRATLEPWVSTLKARGGQFALAEDTALSFEQADAVADITMPLPEGVEAAPSPELAGAAVPETPAEDVEAPANSAENVPDPADPTVPDSGAVAVPAAGGEYSLTPFLSDERVTEFDSPRAVIDPTKDYAALIETNRGQVFVDLFEEQAPRTVNNFVFLALNHFYDGVPFHRVIDEFMAQTGDPLGSGAGGPGYTFADEVVPDFAHSGAGVVSMANAGPGTNGSQFFITLAPTPWLDGNHSIFGAVIDGMEVLPELKRTDPNAPLAVGTPDSSLGLLETQGVDFAGADQMAISDYIIDALGELPADGRRVTLADYDLLFATDPQTGDRLLAFWAASDRIENVYIVEREKD